MYLAVCMYHLIQCFLEIYEPGTMNTWRRAWQPTPVFLPGESHGQRSLAGCSPWGGKESDTTEQPSTTTTHKITDGEIDG